MKTTIITLAIASIFALNNINNASAANKEKVYKNIETNLNEKTLTVTSYLGNNDQNLKPNKMNTTKLNIYNLPEEKTFYLWDAENKEWVASQKYSYEYDPEGQITSIVYNEWSYTGKCWKESPLYTMYVYDTKGNLLSNK